ncbi:MAG: sigma-70 family RNA polymerase sigma factor [Bacteroidota bacterium]
MKELSDEQLMTKVAAGNVGLLRILFERHHAHVYHFLLKMSNDKMLSEDLTQEVFYKLIKYRESYRQGKFVSWLFTIARNSLKTHWSRNQQTFGELTPLEYGLTARQQEKKEEYSHLTKALDRLKPDDRELLILNRIQEIKYAELAEIVQSTPGAVKTKVNRALQKLRVIYFEDI